MLEWNYAEAACMAQLHGSFRHLEVYIAMHQVLVHQLHSMGSVGEKHMVTAQWVERKARDYKPLPSKNFLQHINSLGIVTLVPTR